ncbi:helix-turn-helix domain-containing protein [Chitinimonas sp. BJYL2]|uniref:helix-turn-helix domain-containing protein n=1 Tax=Chitinimonas sp. BJYL2 TaxID=2976696 RepID=UPI0035B538B0
MKANPVATRITHAREFAGFSKAEFARRMAVSAPTVTNWEADKIRPDTDNLSQIAVLCGVSFEWLATGRGGMRFDTPSVREPTKEYEALPADESCLLTIYRKLPAARRRALLTFLESWT